MAFIIDIYKKNREIINYIIVGVLTTVVSLVSYYGCVFTFLNPNDPIQLQMANVISWILAVTFAYITNRKYVFESNNKNKWFELLAFYGARITTLLLEMINMFILVTVIGINDKISKLIVQVIVMIVNYLLSKFGVFRKKNN